jgi:hypothetical protein
VTSEPGRTLDPSPPAASYKISGRGFFSEFNILVYAYAHCMAHGRALFVDVGRTAGPWRQLFSSFPPGASGLRGTGISLAPKTDGKWNEAWMAMRREVRDACLEKRRVRAPQLGFEGTFDELVVLAAHELFRPHAGLVERASGARRAMGLDVLPYAALQLRRGDKVEGYRSPKGEWVVETQIAPFALYAECLGKLAPDIRDVFVLTDDYAAFEEACSQYPDYRFHTLCEPHERGYFHGVQQAAPDEIKLANLEKLLVTVLIARQSSAFVGTRWSNLSIGVWLLHQDRSRCASIELSRPWPPLDPLFLPGRDEI